MSHSNADILRNLEIPGAPKARGSRNKKMIGFLYNLIGFCITSIVGFLLIALAHAGNFSTGAWIQTFSVGALLWIGFRIINDLFILDKTEFLVVEMLGQFDFLKIGGWALVTGNGIISRSPPGGRYTLERSERLIYGGTEDPNAELDFEGASAPVNASVWFHITPQEEVDTDLPHELRLKRAILRFIYLFDDPLRRFNQVMDSIVRPILESYDIDEARTEKAIEKVNKKLKTVMVTRALKLFSIKLVDQRPFVLADIQIPEPVQNIRERRLEARVAADNQRTEGQGFADAVMIIASTGLPEGQQPTPERIQEAERRILALKGLEAVQGVDNINLLGQGMQGVLASLDVAAQGGSR